MRRIHRILVTGGAGFIGSAFIRMLFQQPDFSGRIINLDALTYASNLALVEGLDPQRYRFIHGTILDQQLIEDLCHQERIDTIIHFAAQTHVDRSIADAHSFVETNVQGTLSLLEAVRTFPHIHFHHISTDEVYGSLGKKGSFHEGSPYQPNSPYAASKAASDHLVRAFAHTYQLSTTISHCTNNYGPGQHPEKLIPLMISKAMEGEPLPVYGKGQNIRDWLYVDDHVDALWLILKKGEKSETYDLGGQCERSNLELLQNLLMILSEEMGKDLDQLIASIRFVPDRLGHDFRYAINPKKISKELRWRPKTELKRGLRYTIQWYLKQKALIQN